MTGNVFSHHALLPVPIRLQGQPTFELEFVIDTGFAGYLTLPAEAVAALGLPYSHSISANLAEIAASE